MIFLKKVLTGLVVLILVIGGLYLFSNRKSIMPSDMSDVVETTVEKKETMEEETMDVVEETKTNTITDNSNTMIADLKDVSGGVSEGTGYVLREEGKLSHYVYAMLPSLSNGNMYEGWLVKKEPTLTFFSTGVMQETEDGVFELYYVSGEENVGYDFVVITEETIVDETPEVHILEGTAL